MGRRDPATRGGTRGAAPARVSFAPPPPEPPPRPSPLARVQALAGRATERMAEMARVLGAGPAAPSSTSLADGASAAVEAALPARALREAARALRARPELLWGVASLRLATSGAGLVTLATALSEQPLALEAHPEPALGLARWIVGALILGGLYLATSLVEPAFFLAIEDSCQGRASSWRSYAPELRTVRVLFALRVTTLLATLLGLLLAAVPAALYVAVRGDTPTVVQRGTFTGLALAAFAWLFVEVRFFFAPWVAVLDECDVRAALTRSFELTRGHAASVLFLLVVARALELVASTGFVLAGVGGLITVPLAHAFNALLFRDLLARLRDRRLVA